MQDRERWGHYGLRTEKDDTHKRREPNVRLLLALQLVLWALLALLGQPPPGGVAGFALAQDPLSEWLEDSKPDLSEPGEYYVDPGSPASDDYGGQTYASFATSWNGFVDDTFAFVDTWWETAWITWLIIIVAFGATIVVRWGSSMGLPGVVISGAGVAVTAYAFIVWVGLVEDGQAVLIAIGIIALVVGGLLAWRSSLIAGVVFGSALIVFFTAWCSWWPDQPLWALTYIW